MGVDEDTVTATNVTVAYKVHSDQRISYLAELAGYSRYETVGRLVTLWSRCTALQNDRPGVTEIRMCLGPNGDQLLVDSGLGEQMPDGEIRVRGCENRHDWFGEYAKPSRKANGGKKRAAEAQRDALGRMLPRGVQQPKTLDQQRIQHSPANADAGCPARSSNTTMLDQQPIMLDQRSPATPAIRNPESGEEYDPSRARVIPPAGEVVRSTGQRAEARRKLWGRVWNFCATEYQKAKTDGFDPHARNCWSGTPLTEERDALFARIDDLVPEGTVELDAAVEQAEERIRNRVLVAFADARHKHKSLQYCTPMRMWNSDSFAIGAALSPEQVAQQRAGPRFASRETKPEPPPVKVPTYR